MDATPRAWLCAHLETLRAHGLRLESSDGAEILTVPAVGDPGEIRWREDHVVLLGRLHAIATPANELIQQLARECAAGHRARAACPTLTSSIGSTAGPEPPP